MFELQTAAREKVKLMLGITGPSGSGKTYSALQLAYGITGDWSKIALIDTENRSSLYYAGEKTGPWQFIDFPPTIPQGYHPQNWIKAIEAVEAHPQIEVLILDSISHEWAMAGGSLDTQSKLGGRFQDWAKVTPQHTAFIDKMRQSRLHIVATMRSKQDYAVETSDKGKTTPRKIGLAPVQREGTEYEFGVVFDVDIAHFATASKDRTGIFSPKGPFQITPETGRELLQWAKEGKEPVAPIVKFDVNNKEHYKALIEALKKNGKTSQTGLTRDDLKYFADMVVNHPLNECEQIITNYIKEATPEAKNDETSLPKPTVEDIYGPHGKWTAD